MWVQNFGIYGFGKALIVYMKTQLLDFILDFLVDLSGTLNCPQWSNFNEFFTFKFRWKIYKLWIYEIIRKNAVGKTRKRKQSFEQSHSYKSRGFVGWHNGVRVVECRAFFGSFEPTNVVFQMREEAILKELDQEHRQAQEVTGNTSVVQEDIDKIQAKINKVRISPSSSHVPAGKQCRWMVWARKMADLRSEFAPIPGYLDPPRAIYRPDGRPTSTDHPEARLQECISITLKRFACGSRLAVSALTADCGWVVMHQKLRH